MRRATEEEIKLFTLMNIQVKFDPIPMRNRYEQNEEKHH